MPSDDLDRDTIILVSEVDTYLKRNAALHHLSPVELSMGFYLDRHPKTFKLPLELQWDHPQSQTHGHRPRSDGKTHPFVVPQFIMDAPVCPVPEASMEAKEDYASYALSVFFSFDFIPSLHGDTMWEKLESWRRGQAPRDGAVGIKGLDAFAIRMLTNVENQAEARLTSKKDNARLKASRAAARAALRAQEVRMHIISHY